jgi:hypothetical protein
MTYRRKQTESHKHNITAVRKKNTVCSRGCIRERVSHTSGSKWEFD